MCSRLAREEESRDKEDDQGEGWCYSRAVRDERVETGEEIVVRKG